MSSNDVCEIKSIRTDIVDDIAHKMKDDDIIQKTCNLFKILGDANRVKIILALQYGELFRKENKQIFYSLIDEEILNILEEGEEYANQS